MKSPGRRERYGSCAPEVMKAALATWNGRIAPVFDVAGQIRFLEIDSGKVAAETEEPVGSLTSAEKAQRLAERGVGLLVCGAISRPVQLMVEAYGIEVVPFMAGETGEMIRALLRGQLRNAVHAMPGCGGRRRRGQQGGATGRGPGGTCVCPSCGHEEPHRQGTPCTRIRCQQCGAALVRR